MRDSHHFVNTGRRNTRNMISDKDKDESTKWQQDSNAQLGYGEITKVSNSEKSKSNPMYPCCFVQGALTNLISIFQNAGRFIEEDPELMQKLLKTTPYRIGDYNMTSQNESSFLDIGSGFGKPVFHAAM